MPLHQLVQNDPVEKAAQAKPKKNPGRDRKVPIL